MAEQILATNSPYPKLALLQILQTQHFHQRKKSITKKYPTDKYWQSAKAPVHAATISSQMLRRLPRHLNFDFGTPQLINRSPEVAPRTPVGTAA